MGGTAPSVTDANEFLRIPIIILPLKIRIPGIPVGYPGFGYVAVALNQSVRCHVKEFQESRESAKGNPRKVIPLTHLQIRGIPGIPADNPKIKKFRRLRRPQCAVVLTASDGVGLYLLDVPHFYCIFPCARAFTRHICCKLYLPNSLTYDSPCLHAVTIVIPNGFETAALKF